MLMLGLIIRCFGLAVWRGQNLSILGRMWIRPGVTSLNNYLTCSTREPEVKVLLNIQVGLTKHLESSIIGVHRILSL